ncbi:Hypothetical protein FKW44_011862 [Caligus rogercresseyi]|uniref:Uncharacterized protein n=1 Tax=Caligus rogercresseyi TaxID=217165 RepID=A0A7T8K8E8_CALRO|nr:Hypothetical protein FKW44_011862 [Caligus rogercresseyi]
MAIGSPHFGYMFELIKEDGACCLHKDKIPKYSKCISTAIRRTFKTHRSVRVDSKFVSHCGYWELPIG